MRTDSTTPQSLLLRASVLLLAIALPFALSAQSGNEQGKRQSTGKSDAARQDKSKPGDQKKKTAKEVLLAMLAKEGIRIDSKAKTVHCEAVLTITRDFLEFVAIGPRGKKHEALVTLKCKGSSLNAALMALGAKPGKNIDYKPVVPQPTEEEARNGAPTSIVVPPSGQRVYLSLSWHDDKEVEKHYAIEDLIIDIRKEKPVVGAEWIYIGGRHGPLVRGGKPVYLADYEQNYISTHYAKPDNHLITIKHEFGRYDDNWWPNEDVLPKSGTRCTLSVSLAPIVKRKLAPKAPKKKAADSKKDAPKKKVP